MKKITFLGIILLVSCVTVFAQATKQNPVRSQMLVTSEWLAKNLSNPKLVLIHIGTDQKNYDAGHIPQAIYLRYADIVAARDSVPNELPPVEKLQQIFSQLGVASDSRVILYSESQGLLAARTYFTLDYLGYGDNAALLDGGLEKWKAEKREISTTSSAVTATNITPRINAKVLVTREIVKDISWLAANTENAPTVLLDARQADVYDGTNGNKNLPKNGHIPGAGNLYWMTTLQSKENPALLPVVNLRKMYEAAGIKADQKVVTYCWIGMMASHAYFTLKYLGYDVAMYDGSFTEWAKSEGTTVVTGKNPK